MKLNNTQPTQAEISDCKLRFAQLCGDYGYSEALTQLNREFDREVVIAFETADRIDPPAGVAAGRHVVDPAAVKSSAKYRNLFDNTKRSP